MDLPEGACRQVAVAVRAVGLVTSVGAAAMLSVEKGRPDDAQPHRRRDLTGRRDGRAREQPVQIGSGEAVQPIGQGGREDRKSTRLNSSHGYISYAVFCLEKKKTKKPYIA